MAALHGTFRAVCDNVWCNGPILSEHHALSQLFIRSPKNKGAEECELLYMEDSWAHNGSCCEV